MGGANKLGVSTIYPLEPSSILSTYAEHAIYGAGAALATTTMGDEDLLRKEDIVIPEGAEELRKRPQTKQRPFKETCPVAGTKKIELYGF